MEAICCKAEQQETQVPQAFGMPLPALPTADTEWLQNTTQLDNICRAQDAATSRQA